MDLQELLDKAFMSQTDLAQKLKVTRGTVNRWVAGTRKPKPFYMKQMVGYLETSADELRSAVEESQKKSQGQG